MLAYLEKGNKVFWIISGLLGIALIGIISLWAGHEISLSLFYLIPILSVTWFAGRKLGLVMGCVSAITWFTADILSGVTYSSPIIRYWNTAIRLGFFIVTTLLLPALKELERQTRIAHTDYLTGAPNRRWLFQVIQTEIGRARRYKHPFTLAYIDVDNFKSINDLWGHQTGDKVLSTLVTQITNRLRKTDYIARVGGDEFILLLPETDQASAAIFIPKLQIFLVEELQKQNLPVTLSIGALTWQGENITITVEQIMHQADELMYSAKRNGKNQIAYGIADSLIVPDSRSPQN